MFNFETATPSELNDFIKAHRLSLDNETVFKAIRCVFDFVQEQNRHFIYRNLEDIKTYTRNRRLKQSVSRHISEFRHLSYGEHLQHTLTHAEIFLKSIK
jgi:hypothetical protein